LFSLGGTLVFRKTPFGKRRFKASHYFLLSRLFKIFASQYFILNLSFNDSATTENIAVIRNLPVSHRYNTQLENDVQQPYNK
jgi:hypothetical protein